MFHLDGTYDYLKNDRPINKVLNIWNIKHQGNYFFFDLPCSCILKHQCLSQRNTDQTRPQ